MTAAPDIAADQEGPRPTSAVRTSGLTCRFGELTALSDVSMDVARNTITALMGPNGAGKTTLLNAISGLTAPVHGTVHLGDRDITGWSIQSRARAGLARSFQTPRLLERETVLMNVLVGCEPLSRPGFLHELLNLPSARRARGRDLAAGHQVIEELGLAHVMLRPVQELPFALRRVVEIGRALVSDPEVLLLDEPAAGLEPGERLALAAVLRHLMSGRQVTIVLIEHDVAFVADVAEAAFALDFGRVVASGTVQQVLRAPAVRTSFFGELIDGQDA